ncbi:MAG TPA: glycosyltransferase family A protein [Burkholderiales bacterium]|nr:glycosyltransferase family A protein [Burkholderiales bacterium]
MAPPRLTIAIPTLNRAHCVARTIESALAQARDDVEILVSDNGSTDTTPDVLARFSDPRLRKLRHDATMPAAAHGNFLIEYARGELFLGLSDDDWLEPGFAAAVIEHFDRHPRIAFGYTLAWMHYADIVVPSLPGPETEPGMDFLREFFAGRREVMWCACVTRTRDLRKLQLPDGCIIGDMYLWTRLAALGSVGCVSRHLSHYLWYDPSHRNAVTATPVLPWAREVRQLADGVADAMRQQGLGRAPMAAFQRNANCFVARSTANQFMWNALRGMPRRELLHAMFRAFRYLTGDFTVWLRVIGGTAAPRWLIEQRMLAAARRLAARRDRASAAITP